MGGIEMIDIENPDHVEGDDRDEIEAQPARPRYRAWIDAINRIMMPPDDIPNPDGIVAAAEPEQCSRHACLCYAVICELVIATVFITLMMLSLRFHPTTSGGRALHVIAHVMDMLGLFIMVLGFILILHFVLEAAIGNPEGYKMIDSLFM
ncbi:hypothetical protein VPH35_118864 [Triticum aestivum]